MEDRVEIASGLAQGKTATEIAVRIGCAKTTVSREVKRRYTIERKGSYGRSFNVCANRNSCKVAHECLDCRSPRKNSCAYCSVICCSDKCREYSPVYSRIYFSIVYVRIKTVILIGDVPTEGGSLCWILR